MVVGADGTFTVSIEPGAVYTYTTVPTTHPGAAAFMAALQPAPVPLAAGDDGPTDAPFPLPYAGTRRQAPPPPNTHTPQCPCALVFLRDSEPLSV